MCTDNMPSGSAMKLGDVLTMRNGTTVEVLNTDAEGRLVMADALVLATEEPVDAIVDIATLTGACLRTFGVEIAGCHGQRLGGWSTRSGRAGDASTSRSGSCRCTAATASQLDSVDRRPDQHGRRRTPGRSPPRCSSRSSSTARPWAHIDIAGTAQLPAPRTWRNKGATGFGTRLLIELALGVRRPAGRRH